MGAWGEEPFANDTALDWIHGPQESLLKHIDDAFNTYLASLTNDKAWTDGEYEAIAAAQLLLDFTHAEDDGDHSSTWTNVLDLTILISCSDKYSGIYAKAVDCLEKIIVGQWIEEWGSNRPKKIYNEMIKELEARKT